MSDESLRWSPPVPARTGVPHRDVPAGRALAVLAGTHLLAAAGVALDADGPARWIAAGLGLATTVLLAVTVLLLRHRFSDELPDQAVAAAVVLAACVSGIRAGIVGDPLAGADVAVALLAASGLRSQGWWLGAVAVGTGGWLVTSALAGPSSLSPGLWLVFAAVAAGSPGAAYAVRSGVLRLRDTLLRSELLAAEQAVNDPVTGAYNRRGLELMAVPMIENARRKGEAVHAMFVDVDDFRAANERFGRSVGDAVLTGVGEALLGSVRTTDVVCRWTGDQFVVLGPGTGPSPLELERRVNGQLAADPPVPVTVWPVHFSIGSATLVPWDEGNLDSVLSRAEEDMRLRRSLRRQSQSRPGDPAPEPPAAPASPEATGVPDSSGEA